MVETAQQPIESEDTSLSIPGLKNDIQSQPLRKDDKLIQKVSLESSRDDSLGDLRFADQDDSV
jgi:hypothetical protein